VTTAATGAARLESPGRQRVITAASTKNRLACANSSTEDGRSHGSRRTARVRSLRVLTSRVTSNGYHAAITIAARTAASRYRAGAVSSPILRAVSIPRCNARSVRSAAMAPMSAPLTFEMTSRGEAILAAKRICNSSIAEL